MVKHLDIRKKRSEKTETRYREITPFFLFVFCGRKKLKHHSMQCLNRGVWGDFPTLEELKNCGT